MSNSKEEQINFLDSLFTQKDFSFLNSLEGEMSLIENQIKKQEQKRDFIVDSINYCEKILKNPLQENITLFSSSLDEIKKAFILVNFNIKSLLSLKQDLTNINSSIINLLIAIESAPNNKSSHIAQAQQLSKDISDYSNSCIGVKTQISNNDLNLNTLFSNDKFKDIFDTISNRHSDLYTSNNTNNQSISNKTIDISIDIPNNVENIYTNNILRISEKENKVYLPYNHNEIKSYLVQFPEDYNSAEDVIQKEFVFPLKYYINHPVLSRFRESYSLIRDREAKSVMEAIRYSTNLMFNYELNPTIIAACKTQEQLENYLSCLESNQLDNFKDFEIKFEISPL